jgi:small multidrug resistance family-3 protein
MNAIIQLVQSTLGAFVFLAIAAIFESFGDSCFQSAMYHSAGPARVAAAVSGTVVLVAYGVMVNLPRWDFGRLIGIYVAVFFISAQVINRVRFGHPPTPPIYAGGALIVAGGLGHDFLEGMKQEEALDGMLSERASGHLAWTTPHLRFQDRYCHCDEF